MQVELVLGFAWFFGSLYALVSVFRPLPPFRGRKQAGLGLVAVQAAAVVAAVAMPTAKPPAATPQAPEMAPAATAEASSDEPAGAPSYLVRIKPGEHRTVAPAAKAGDVAALKVKTRAGLKTLDAADAVLTNAVQNSRIDLAREAENDARKVSFTMVTDREPLIGTAEMEKVAPCERAASALAALARSVVTDGQGVSAVQERLRLQDRYGASRRECEAWVRQ